MLGAALAVGLALPFGCGVSGGVLLFHSGMVKSPTTAAEFKLAHGPVLVLVDDFDELLDTPERRIQFARQLSDELVTRKAAQTTIRPDIVNDLRREQRDFDQRGCREVGRMAHAEQVVWLRVRDFYAGEEASERGEAAKVTVAVKVINALEEKDKLKVRLWPSSYAGSPVAVELTVGEVGRAGSRDAVTKALGTKLAGQVAKLFYDHSLEDFEDK